LIETFLLRRQEAVQLLHESYHFLGDLLGCDGSAELLHPFLLDFIHHQLNSSRILWAASFVARASPIVSSAANTTGLESARLAFRFHPWETNFLDWRPLEQHFCPAPTTKR
jgi:hypothetical protein